MATADVTECRSCGAGDLHPVVSLGSTPVANALVDPATAPPTDPTFPLAVVTCSACTLVQLSSVLPADAIFDDGYPYFSSYSDALGDHARDLIAQLRRDRRLGPSSLVVEVGSNDGYLLRHVVAAGLRAVGIDPAPGPARAARDAGVPTIDGFFGLQQAVRMRAEHGPADVVIANNVMAHVPELNDFVAGLAHLLDDDGLLTVENPYVRDLVDQVEFDTIYHEHYCYFSSTAVESLMRRHGLHLNDVEHFPDLHGGSLRWHIGRQPRRTRRCQDHLDAEVATGLTGLPYYDRFAARVRACQQALRDLLDELHAAGRIVAAYGAAAKGSTLLNSAGIGVDRVAYVVDRNVHKHGRLMPGCRLPIRPVDVLSEDPPDDLLLLAWNHAGEIVAQQRAYAAAGGTFYVPIPRPRRLDPLRPALSAGTSV